MRAPPNYVVNNYDDGRTEISHGNYPRVYIAITTTPPPPCQPKFHREKTGRCRAHKFLLTDEIKGNIRVCVIVAL